MRKQHAYLRLRSFKNRTVILRFKQWLVICESTSYSWNRVCERKSCFLKPVDQLRHRMLALLRVVILVANPGATLVRGQVLTQMRIEEQHALAEILDQYASQICTQSADMVIKADDDVTTGLYQPADAHEGLFRIVRMMQYAVGDNDIHRMRPQGRHE